MFMKKELIEKRIVEEAKRKENSVGFSDLVSKSDVNSPYGIGFIDGSVWMMQQFQWVSVEDKLPPCSDDDLFLLGIDSKGGKDIPDIGYMHDSADHVPRKDLFISTELIEVTHWMKVRNLTKNE